MNRNGTAGPHFAAWPLVIFAMMIVLCLPACDHSSPADPSGGQPDGQLVFSSGCKNEESSGAAHGADPEKDCLEYEYDALGTLHLRHINACFNCCAEEIWAVIMIEGSVITIEEFEEPGEGGFCECLCLFDVHYDISNLPPGNYTIKVVEMYLNAGDVPLEFSCEVRLGAPGYHCEERSGYPWD